MTQGKVFVADKTLSGPQGDGTPPVCPPSYEEATAGPSLCHSYQGGGEMLTEFTWQDKNIRRIFIRKVYCILMIQLCVAVAVVALFSYSEPVKTYIQANPGWYWASYVVFCVTFISLSFCSVARRCFPWNLILLAVFTLSLSYMTAMVSSYYNTRSVLVTLGITALVCLSVTVFSFQTKIDFTSCQGVLLILSMTVCFCGIFLACVVPFGYVPWLQAIYAVLGAIVFTMFLVFDTQVLLGKKHSSISPEDYIFASLSIYLDIIYIFSFLLQLFGMDRY
ncbi:protein lifeguard 2-like isoform X2 [Brienomyrus brachyistius]|uniref:protein lifeguard 2-like isoform X2 n=1 Tax=Brienomyrus brachyistius TaxID=42636 RepID=UPI0020B2D986|nr:protein lifeguard 2-like isoform X2 [Brienomyrus brachyistius]